MYSLLFGLIFVALGFLNLYIHKTLEPFLFAFGLFFIAISVFLFFYDKHNTKEAKSHQNFKTEEKNKAKLNSLQPQIDKYNDFIKNVYLCARHTVNKKTTKYVCIHKKSKELFSFSSKVVGSQGILDVCCFDKSYKKITSYSQLIENLNSISKSYFTDLNESNWENYFNFMFENPKDDGEILKKQLLSSDSDVVRNAIFVVINLALKSPTQRKVFLSGAYENLSLIKNNTNGLEMGGIFASNGRFVSRAIQIIEGNNTDKCFCRLTIDEFGAGANGLTEKGFILIQPDEDINKYSKRGIIECPVCRKRYTIIEEYTGWHIPTIIHCIETIPKADEANHGDNDVKHCPSNEHHFVDLKHFTGGSECHCSKCGLLIKFNRGTTERIEPKEMDEFLKTYHGSTFDL